MIASRGASKTLPNARSVTIATMVPPTLRRRKSQAGIDDAPASMQIRALGNRATIGHDAFAKPRSMKRTMLPLSPILRSSHRTPASPYQRPRR